MKNGKVVGPTEALLGDNLTDITARCAPIFAHHLHALPPLALLALSDAVKRIRFRALFVRLGACLPFYYKDTSTQIISIRAQKDVHAQI